MIIFDIYKIIIYIIYFIFSNIIFNNYINLI